MSCKVYLIDLYNTIESFRELKNALNSPTSALNEQDVDAQIHVGQVHAIVANLYGGLCQRVTREDVQLNGDLLTSLMMNWLIELYDSSGTGFLPLLALKTFLILLSHSPNYSSKLNYFFSLLCDEEQRFLVPSHFDAFLRHLSTLSSYLEPDVPFFSFNEDLASSVFDFKYPVSLQIFLQVFTSSRGLEMDFKSWLIIYHRLGEAQLVVHQGLKCGICKRRNFNGFRYKCKQCRSLNICQNCFWTGEKATSGSARNHDPNNHACKEYLLDSNQSSTKLSMAGSLRRSLRCIPKKSSSTKLDDVLERNLATKKLDLSNIVHSPRVERKLDANGRTVGSSDQWNFIDIPAIDPEGSFHNILSTNCEPEVALVNDLLVKLNTKEQDRQNLSKVNANLVSYEKIIEELERKKEQLLSRIDDLKRNSSGGSISSKTSEPEQVEIIAQENDHLKQDVASLKARKSLLMNELEKLMTSTSIESSTSSELRETSSTHHTFHSSNGAQIEC